MRRFAVPILIALVFLSGGFAPPSGASDPFPAGAIQRLSTPRELARFLAKNFDFVEDQKLFGLIDHWQTPEQFWQRRAGDCEDYALFSKRVLERMGREAWVISFYGEGGFAHTVTLFKEKGFYNVMNEDRLHEFRAKTIEEALSLVHADWLWGAVAERRGGRGWPLRRMLNPQHHPATPLASSHRQSLSKTKVGGV